MNFMEKKAGLFKNSSFGTATLGIEKKAGFRSHFSGASFETNGILKLSQVFWLIPCMAFMGCASGGEAAPTRAQPAAAPEWVWDLERAYPFSGWVAATGQGASRNEAEDAAMNSLAQAFKTDVASLTEMNQRFAQIVDDAGKKNVAFSESRDFSSQVRTASNVSALIGVETGVFQELNGETWHANARMNRRDCAARYAGMVRENDAVINSLLNRAANLQDRSGFEAYAALQYAESIAQATDNFQNILEVLDPSTMNRRPGYGGAAAIRTRMLALAGRIVVGLMVDTADQQEAVTISRALGSFFTGMGFKINEQGTGNYTLNVRAAFESVETTQIKTCRWFLDAALEEPGGGSLFSYTGQDQVAHSLGQEARRLALQDMERSIKAGDFAGDFDAWLGSLLE
jgi:hypothetical protein